MINGKDSLSKGKEFFVFCCRCYPIEVNKHFDYTFDGE
jgi:hypothetical protein